MKKKLQTVLVWIFLVILFAVLFQLSRQPKTTSFREFKTFLEDVEHDSVSSVRINNNEIVVELYNGSSYMTLGLVDDELTRVLSERGIVMHFGEEENPFGSILKVLLPIVLLLAAFIYFSRKFSGQGSNLMALRRSRARLLNDEIKVSFDDVGGCAEAKNLFADVVDFLKNPDRWTNAGARLPRGVLLEGPPGCGKTLLARAVAGETDAKFFLVSASEFVELFVGVGAARVRDMFETAVKEAPAVIFIDELDAVGRRRGSGIGAGHDEREQTLNQLLVCLDGFEKNDRVVVIAATNRPDILDSALLRPGRFDRRIRVPEQQREDRLETLKIHTMNKPLAEDVSLEQLADQTAGYTGSKIESFCNEATLIAVRRCRISGEANEVAVSMKDFQDAFEIVQTQERLFTKVDMLIIESATQLSEPTGRAVVRIRLKEGDSIEGEVIWADASFVKLRELESGEEKLVPKFQIVTVEALEGTEEVEREEVRSDVWASSMPDMA